MRESAEKLGRSGDQQGVDDSRLARKLRREARRAQRSAALERAARALWPVLVVLLAFAAVTYLGAWRMMGDWLRLGVLTGFAGAALGALIFAVRSFRWPSLAEGRARLDHAIPSRPVSSYDDALALGRENPIAESLWRAHKDRVAIEAAKARAPQPDLRIGGERDPWALRYFAALGLGAAVLLGADVGRVSEAFAPIGVTLESGAEGPSLEMWASPPAYTGAPPIYFSDEPSRFSSRRIPAGSSLSFLLFDSPEAPVLTIAPAPAESPLRDEGDGVYTAEILIDAPVEISLALGDAALADLAFETVPDEGPSVWLVEPPERGAEGLTTFSFGGADDYGVARAWASIVLDENAGRESPPDAHEPLVFDLPTPLSGPGYEVDETSDEPAPSTTAEHDFADHPWIGLPVVMTLHVEDAAGNAAQSLPHSFTMTGRRFTEQMAKALIEQRGALSWRREDAPRALRILESAVRFPGDYFDDPGGYLLTRSAISRLAYALSEDKLDAEFEAIIARLYEAAVRLEEGGFENLREQLARMIRQLRDAIENGASDEELAELMDQLREAIQKYMQALAEMAERNPEMAQRQGENSQEFNTQDLENMLRQLEDAARDGVQDQAEQMLSMLEQLLNNLRPSQQQQAGGEGEQGEEQEGDGELQELEDMIGEQQRLAERSFDDFMQGLRGQDGQPQQGQPGQPGQQGEQGQEGQQGQQGQNGQQGQAGRQGQGEPNGSQGGDGDQLGQAPGDGREDARRPGGRGQGESLADIRRRQEALRDQLDRFRDGLDGDGQGATGEDFNRAEEAMREAERALRGGRSGDAADEQMRALDALREGGRGLAETRERQRAETEDVADGEGDSEGEGDTAARSPLSGTGSAATDGRGVQVPGELNASRARDILKELRRRAGERARSPEELRYFERLLERFR